MIVIPSEERVSLLSKNSATEAYWEGSRAFILSVDPRGFSPSSSSAASMDWSLACLSLKASRASSREIYVTRSTSGSDSRECLILKISSSFAVVTKVTLISILLWSSAREVSSTALKKEINPTTRSVTVITRTEARETVPFLQKLKNPVRITRLIFNLEFSIFIFPYLIIPHYLASLHGNNALV